MKTNSKGLNYYLIACGTSTDRSEDPSERKAFKDAIEKEVKTIVDIFKGDFGYEHVLQELRCNPLKQDLLGSFSDWVFSEDRTNQDIVIFYYTGHGEVINNRHYLILDETQEDRLHTALKTDDIVQVLEYQRSKIRQILFIFDTCYSTAAAARVWKFQAEDILPNQSSNEENTVIRLLTTSRYMQQSNVGVFTNSFRAAIEGCDEVNDDSFISLESIVDFMNGLGERQKFHHFNLSQVNQSYFFPCIHLRNLLTKAEKCSRDVLDLVGFLYTLLDEAIIISGMNAFIMMSESSRSFVLSKSELEKRVREFLEKPISDDGICQVILFSEWLKLYIDNTSSLSPNKIIQVDREISQKQEILKKNRLGSILFKNRELASSLMGGYEKILQEKEFRLQVIIEPENNVEGRYTSNFHILASIWLKDRSLPMASYSDKILIKDLEIDSGDNILEGSILCHELGQILPRIIQNVRLSLINKEDKFIPIELFIPLDLYCEPFEHIKKKTGRRKVSIGSEYPVFINSFERYFDEDFYGVVDALRGVKKRLWENSEIPKLATDENIIESQNGSFIAYVGLVPNEGILELIEDGYILALWSRNEESNQCTGEFGEGSDCREWAQDLKNYRKNYPSARLSHFRDDLFPKPTERIKRSLLPKV